MYTLFTITLVWTLILTGPFAGFAGFVCSAASAGPRLCTINADGFDRILPAVMGVTQYNNACPPAQPDCFTSTRLDTLGIRLVGSTEGLSGLNGTEAHWTVNKILSQMRSPTYAARWHASPVVSLKSQLL